MKRELTAEEEVIMKKVREEWIHRAHNTNGEIDKPKFEKGIKWLYEDILKLEKPSIVYCDSWIDAIMQITLAKKQDVLKKKVEEKIEGLRNSLFKGLSKKVDYCIFYGSEVANQVRYKASLEEAVKKDINESFESGPLHSVRNLLFYEILKSVPNDIYKMTAESEDVIRLTKNNLWHSVLQEINSEIENLYEAIVIQSNAKLEPIVTGSDVLVNLYLPIRIAQYDQVDEVDENVRDTIRQMRHNVRKDVNDKSQHPKGDFFDFYNQLSSGDFFDFYNQLSSWVYEIREATKAKVEQEGIGKEVSTRLLALRFRHMSEFGREVSGQVNKSREATDSLNHLPATFRIVLLSRDTEVKDEMLEHLEKGLLPHSLMEVFSWKIYKDVYNTNDQEIIDKARNAISSNLHKNVVNFYRPIKDAVLEHLEKGAIIGGIGMFFPKIKQDIEGTAPIETVRNKLPEEIFKNVSAWVYSALVPIRESITNQIDELQKKWLSSGIGKSRATSRKVHRMIFEVDNEGAFDLHFSIRRATSEGMESLVEDIILKVGLGTDGFPSLTLKPGPDYPSLFGELIDDWCTFWTLLYGEKGLGYSEQPQTGHLANIESSSLVRELNSKLGYNPLDLSVTDSSLFGKLIIGYMLDVTDYKLEVFVDPLDIADVDGEVPATGDFLNQTESHAVRKEIREKVGKIFGELSDIYIDYYYFFWVPSETISFGINAKKEKELLDQLKNLNTQVNNVVNEAIREVIEETPVQEIRQTMNEYSSYVGFSNYGWVSFYDFFERIGVLKNEDFTNYRQLIESGVFECYEYKNVVFAIRPPKKILKNEQGQLHSITESAFEFPDGSDYCFINGRSVPSWIVKSPELITKEKFLTEPNNDLRGAMYTVLGQQKMFDLLGAKEVMRKHANNEDYILYETQDEDPELGKLKWVGVQCPSTGTKYLLGVPPETTCPLEGVAGTFGLSASQYKLNQNT